MKLSTIISNYYEFNKSYEKLGYRYETINIRNKRHIEKLLNEVIDDIILYNNFLDIYDYDANEKKQILSWLNNLGRKRVTFMQKLVEINIDNYYEDQSILDGSDYDDMQLFESEKILFKDKLDNKIYFDSKDSIFVNDWHALVKVNDFDFEIGHSSTDEENYIMIVDTKEKYIFSSIDDDFNDGSDKMESFMFIFNNFEDICESLFKKLPKDILHKLQN